MKVDFKVVCIYNTGVSNGNIMEGKNITIIGTGESPYELGRLTRKSIHKVYGQKGCVCIP